MQYPIKVLSLWKKIYHYVKILDIWHKNMILILYSTLYDKEEYHLCHITAITRINATYAVSQSLQDLHYVMYA